MDWTRVLLHSAEATSARALVKQGKLQGSSRQAGVSWEAPEAHGHALTVPAWMAERPGFPVGVWLDLVQPCLGALCGRELVRTLIAPGHWSTAP